MKVTAKTKICVIIGDPVEHSLSPAMHNAAYEALEIDDQFVFVASRVKIEEIESVVKAVRVMNIRGLTCTIPHKIEVMKYLDKIDPIAEKIGAVNTVVNNGGVLEGYNTDYLGVLTPLEKMIDLKGKKVALIGAGGAARAAAYAVTSKGAKLKIFNRTIENAEEIAKDFGAEFGPLDDLEGIKDYDIIFNSTSVGMEPNINESPVPAEYLNENQIVFDAIYAPHETQLLKDAKGKGAKIIHGLEMLLHQGTAQFEIYTGQKAPEEIMQKILENNVR